MELSDAIFIAVLAFGQVGLLLLSQYLIPEYYFGTAQFLVRRQEFKWKAVVFRLAIPFSAGLVVPFLPVENETLVAISAGFLAWFLILWPIAWAPTLMVPPIRRFGVIVALWGLWWAFFAVLPWSGVALATWTQSVLTDPDASWWQGQLAWELFAAPAVVFLGIVAARFVDREVPLIGGASDDESDDPDDDLAEHEDYEYEPEPQERPWLAPAPWQITVALFSVALLPFLLLGVLIALLARGSRWTSER
jgi:hypothetical protein